MQSRRRGLAGGASHRDTRHLTKEEPLRLHGPHRGGPDPAERQGGASDPATSQRQHRRHPGDGEVPMPAAELHEGEARVLRPAREPHLNDQLVVVTCRGERPLEEVNATEGPLAVDVPDHDLRVQCHGHGRQLGGRVRVGNRAAQGAAMTDGRMPDEADRLGE